MRNSAKNHDGQTSKALEFEFGLAVDSEETFSMASKQVFFLGLVTAKIQRYDGTNSPCTPICRRAAEAIIFSLLNSKSPGWLTNVQPLQNTQENVFLIPDFVHTSINQCGVIEGFPSPHLIYLATV